MKINELSKMTQINPETIRLYRKMGFLSPKLKQTAIMITLFLTSQA
jgi:DNA-binding transcriptional MerR regulator